MMVANPEKKLLKVKSEYLEGNQRISKPEEINLFRNNSMIENFSSCSTKIFLNEEDISREDKSLNKMINKLIMERSLTSNKLSNNYIQESSLGNDTNSSFTPLDQPASARRRISKFDYEYEEVKPKERQLQSFKNVYDSESAEERLSDHDLFSILVRKDSDFYRIYSIFLTLSVFLSIGVEPIKVVYLKIEDNWREELVILLISLLFDLIFIFELLIHFIVVPKKSKRSGSIRLFSSCLNLQFLLNILCSIPINLLYLAISKRELPFLLEWLFLFRIAKLYYLKPFKKLVMTQNLELNRVLKFIIILFLIIHSFSCLFVSLGLNSNSVTWISQNDLDNGNLGELYAASIYFHLVTIYTIGFGDILSTNTDERAYNCILLVSGVLLFSFAVSSISNFFVEDKRTQIQHQFEIFDKVCRKTKVPFKMRLKVMAIIKRKHKNRNSDANFEFVKTLPSQLKMHLAMCIYRKKLRKLRFFKGQPHEFILSALPLIKTVEFEKEELIVGTGEFLEEVYIAVTGEIRINLGKAFYGIELGKIKPNLHFGDIYITYKSQCNFDLFASGTRPQFYIIQKADFLVLMANFREEVGEMLASSYKILEFIESARIILKKVSTFTGSEGDFRQAFKHYKRAFVMNEYSLEDIDLSKHGINIIDRKNSEQNEKIIKEVILKMRENTKNMLLNNPNIKGRKAKKHVNAMSFFNNVGKESQYLEESPLKKMRDNMDSQGEGRSSFTTKLVPRDSMQVTDEFIQNDLIKLIGSKERAFRNSTVVERPDYGLNSLEGFDLNKNPTQGTFTPQRLRGLSESSYGLMEEAGKAEEMSQRTFSSANRNIIGRITTGGGLYTDNSLKVTSKFAEKEAKQGLKLQEFKKMIDQIKEMTN